MLFLKRLLFLLLLSLLHASYYLKLGPNGDEDIVAEIMGRRFCPSLITTHTWEEFNFAGHRIKITEATDSYGAVIWPSVLLSCNIIGFGI